MRPLEHQPYVTYPTYPILGSGRWNMEPGDLLY